jgi:hypothetical protein
LSGRCLERFFARAGCVTSVRACFHDACLAWIARGRVVDVNPAGCTGTCKHLGRASFVSQMMSKPTPSYRLHWSREHRLALASAPDIRARDWCDGDGAAAKLVDGPSVRILRRVL